MTIFLLSLESVLELTKSAAVFIHTHKADVLLFSCITAAIFVPILYIPLQRTGNHERPKEEWENDESWARLFAAAVAVWSVQYAIQFLLLFSLSQGWISAPLGSTLGCAVMLLVYACYSANNLLFLGAAIKLKSSERVLPPPKPEPNFRSPLLPWWALLLAVVALVGMLPAFMALPAWGQAAARAPDVFFASYCLYQLGRALTINIKFYNQILGMVAAGVAVAYVIIHVFYGLNPMIAEMEAVQRLIPKAATLAERLDILDTLAFAFALPLKFGLLFPAFTLLMQDLFTFKDLRKDLHLVTHKRAELLSRSGLVRSVGERLGADVVDLSIRLPGRNRDRIVSLEWNRDERPPVGGPGGHRGTDEMVRKFRLDEANKVVRRCFEDKKVINYSKTVAAPIYYHGAVIACLRVEKYHMKLLSTEAIQQLRQFAAIASPSVQSFRELAALDQMRLRVAAESVQVENFTTFIKAIAAALEDVLTPVVCRLEVRFGFEKLPSEPRGDQYVLPSFRRWTDGRTWDELPANFTDSFYHRRYDIFGHGLANKQKRLDGKFELEKAEIGDIVFALPAESEDLYPAIGTKLLHRKSVASVIVDAYLDYARIFFNRLLKDFSTDLNRERITISWWFMNVARAARKAGLLWVVFTQADDDTILGPGEAAKEGAKDGKRAEANASHGVAELVRALRRRFNAPAAITRWRLSELDEPPPAAGALLKETHNVVCVPLDEETGAHLWLGVAREDFGPELEFQTPWRMFFEGLAEVASSALLRFRSAQQLQQLQADASRNNELFTLAATLGTVVHQLMNMARNQSVAADALADALHIGELKASDEIEEIIQSINSGANRQLSLIKGLIDHTIVDERRPCNLRIVVEQAAQPLDWGLTLREIKIENRVRPDININVPFYVASLALSNLVSNAMDAVGSGGTIRIDADNEGRFVECFVSDDGPGIPRDIATNLFELGITTKGRNGGRGLYMVARALNEHGSDIELMETSGGGATFRIRFPKPEEERPHEQYGNLVHELRGESAGVFHAEPDGDGLSTGGDAHPDRRAHSD